MRGAKAAIRGNPLAGVAIPLLLLGASCGRVEFTEQRAFLRHDAERDVLEALLLYEGLHPPRSYTVHFGKPAWGTLEPYEERKPPEPKHVANAFDVVARIADGHRLFLLGTPVLEVDLDLPGDPIETDAETMAFREGISVIASGLFLDEDGRLCAYQAIRIPEVSAGVRFLNDGIREMIGGWADSESFATDAPALDDETRAAWVREAREGVPWITLHEGCLRLRFPATPRTAARLLEGLLADIADDGEDAASPAGWLAALASCLAAVEVADGHVALDFQPGGEDRPTLRFAYPHLEYSDEVLERLRFKGRHPRAMTEEEVLAKVWPPEGG